MNTYVGRQGGRQAGDFDGQGSSTIDLISSGRSFSRAAAVANRQAVSDPLGIADGFELPWGSVGVGMITLVAVLLYLDGRILR